MKTSVKTLLIATSIAAGLAAAAVYADWPGVRPGCAGPQAMGFGGPGMGPGRHGAGGGHFGLDADLRIERLTEALDLSAPQRDKLRAIVDKNRPQARALRDQMVENRKQLLGLSQQGGARDADLRRLADAQGKLVADMIVQRAKVRGEIEAVLTPEQREALKSRFGHRRPFRGADAGAASSQG